MATGEALVCKLKNISPIEGADNILQANLFGETIIISKDYKEGQLGLLFDCETLLSDQFCKENNLFRHNNLNKNKDKVGYFDDNPRVRPIKLKGVKCSAFFTPIEHLDYIRKDYPKEGTQITEWLGNPICSKYVRPTRGGNKQNKVAKKVQQVLHFAEHIDTDQLLRNLHKINIGDKLIVTSKVHGTSCRVGLLPTIPRTRFKAWLHKFFNKKNVYRYVVGSRHALKHVEGQDIDKKDSYYKDDIWTQSAYENFHGKLTPGETIYYEIVGYLPSGESIMPCHSNEKLKKFLEKQEYKDFIQKYGNETIFHYGCAPAQSKLDKDSIPLPGEHKIFVYRITLTTEHGQAIDLSWEQVKRRCEELGVNYVPEIIRGQFLINDNKRDVDYYRNESFWQFLTERDDPHFPQHINEGICVRVENGSLRPQVYKSKRYVFKVLEGIIKDTAEFADIEESN